MKIILLIPIYNDRESLKKLIEDINFEVKDLASQISIIVVNDASSQQITDNYANTENIIQSKLLI
jgi:glycosyltransferase involved in cell wall biosynthesis